MPSYTVCLKANMSHVDKLQPQDINEYEWIFKIVCTSCREENPSPVNVCASRTVEKSRSEAHILVKCKSCSSPGSMNLLPNTSVAYTSEDSGQFKCILKLECRGWEPSAFIPKDGWKVICSDSGTVFTDISLEDSEWVEYDEVSSQPIEIFEVETRIDRS